MHLTALHLRHFRNHSEQDWLFSPAVNALVGPNGSGKTNVLEAIYLLCLTKTSASWPDAFNIQHEEPYFQVDGWFEVADSQERITCSFQRGQKKAFLHDLVPYERLLDHVGKYPLVFLSPEDTDLIRDSSDSRRKFVDGILSQASALFLRDYQQYHRTLDQRNRSLKQMAATRRTDHTLLDAYDHTLILLGEKLYQARAAFLTDFLPHFQRHYAVLSGGQEHAGITYESSWKEADFPRQFKESRPQDVLAQRTLLGCHRDDFILTLNEQPIRKFGSQGQKKSFVMALRMAQYDLMAEQTGQSPILLLDDIFDKLDEHRIQHLISHINQPHMGQVFLTDARPERTRAFLTTFARDVQVWDASK